MRALRESASVYVSASVYERVYVCVRALSESYLLLGSPFTTCTWLVVVIVVFVASPIAYANAC